MAGLIRFPTLVRLRQKGNEKSLKKFLERDRYPAVDIPLVGIAPLQALIELRDEKAPPLAIAFDLETDGLVIYKNKITWISWAIGEYCGAIPLSHRNNSSKNENEAEVWATLKTILKDKSITTIWHNAKFDLSMLISCGVISIDDVNPNRIFDTMLASYVLNPVKTREGGRHGLKNLYDDWVRRSIPEGDAFSKVYEACFKAKGGYDDRSDPPQPDYESLVNGGSLEDAPLDQVSIYAAFDAWTTFQLFKIFKDKLAQDPGVERYFYGIEMPHLMTTLQMYLSGMKLDPQQSVFNNMVSVGNPLRFKIDRWEKWRDETETQIFELVGRTFNLASQEEIRKTLFTQDLNFRPKGRNAGTTRQSVDKDVLSELFVDSMAQSPKTQTIIAKIMYWKHLDALVRKHNEMYSSLNSYTGRIHANLRPTTASGRYASPRPNVLALSSSSEIKDYIVPEVGWSYVIADFSQIDLRVIANESGEVARTADDLKMLNSVNQGHDLHTTTLRIVDKDAKARFNWNKIKFDKTTSKASVKDVSGVSVVLTPDEEVVAKRLAQARSDVAKPINFGISYGLGPSKLLSNLNINEDLRKEIVGGGDNTLELKDAEHRNEWIKRVQYEIDRTIQRSMDDVKGYLKSFHKEYPSIKKFQDQVQRDLERSGFTFNVFGRKCFAEIYTQLDQAEFDLKIGRQWFRVSGRKIDVSPKGIDILITKVSILTVTEPPRKRKLRVADLEVAVGQTIYQVDENAIRAAFETLKVTQANLKAIETVHVNNSIAVDLTGSVMATEILPAAEYEAERLFYESISWLHLNALNDICDIFEHLEHVSPADVFGSLGANTEGFPPVAPFVKLTHESIKRVVITPNVRYPEKKELTYLGFDKLRRNLISSRVSSTSMDICKIAMTRFLKIAKRIWPDSNTRPKIVNCVHDEIAVECLDTDAHRVYRMLLKIMKSRRTYQRFIDSTRGRKLLVEIDAEAGIGHSYATAKP